jgi:hypothetical protein
MTRIVPRPPLLDRTKFLEIRERLLRAERRMEEYLNSCPKPLPPWAIAVLSTFTSNGKIEEK